jgi:hypothetical protein
VRRECGASTRWFFSACVYSVLYEGHFPLVSALSFFTSSLDLYFYFSTVAISLAYEDDACVINLVRLTRADIMCVGLIDTLG